MSGARGRRWLRLSRPTLSIAVIRFVGEKRLWPQVNQAGHVRVLHQVVWTVVLCKCCRYYNFLSGQVWRSSGSCAWQKISNFILTRTTQKVKVRSHTTPIAHDWRNSNRRVRVVVAKHLAWARSESVRALQIITVTSINSKTYYESQYQYCRLAQVSYTIEPTSFNTKIIISDHFGYFYEKI